MRSGPVSSARSWWRGQHGTRDGWSRSWLCRTVLPTRVPSLNWGMVKPCCGSGAGQQLQAIVGGATTATASFFLLPHLAQPLYPSSGHSPASQLGELPPG